MESGRAGVVAVLMCSIGFLVVVTFTMVMVALPLIQLDLAMEAGDLQWLITGYGLTFGGLLLAGGRLADYLGRRRALVLGLVVFGIGSVFCLAAPSGLLLVVGRAVQGAGGAVVMPAAMSILTSSFEAGRARTLALGGWAAVGSAGAALGNVLGGVLSSFAHWRWMFVIQAAMVAVAVVLVFVVVRATAPNRDRPPGVLSGALLTAALGAVILGMSLLSREGTASLTPWLVLAVVPVALIAFALVERASSAPLIPLGFLRRREALGYAFAALGSGTMMSCYYHSSLLLQQHMGFDGLQTGLAFVLWTTMTIITTQVASRLIGRFGPRLMLLIGFVITASGAALFALGIGGSFFPLIALSFTCLGIGSGCVMITSMVLALSVLPDSEQGLASGILNATQQTGGVVMLSIMVLVAAATTASLVAGGMAAEPALLEGYRVVGIAATGLAVAAIVIAALGVPSRKAQAG